MLEKSHVWSVFTGSDGSDSISSVGVEFLVCSEVETERGGGHSRQTRAHLHVQPVGRKLKREVFAYSI